MKSALAAAIAAPLMVQVPDKAPGLILPEPPKLVRSIHDKPVSLAVPLTLGILAPSGRYHIEFMGTYSGSGANYSRANVPFGDASSNREIIVTYVFNDNTGVTTMTIGGVAATKATPAVSSNNNPSLGCGCFFATVPTGSSGTISMNNGSTGQIIISVFRVELRPNIGTQPIASDVTIQGNGNTATYTLSVPKNGLVISTTFLANSTWTSTDNIAMVGSSSTGASVYTDPLLEADTITITGKGGNSGIVGIAWVFT